MSAIAHNREQVRFIRDCLTHQLKNKDESLEYDEFPTILDDIESADDIYINNEASASLPTAKFPKEARMCLCVALVLTMKNGEYIKEEKRGEIFNYSEKKFISMKEYNEKIEEEIFKIFRLTDTVAKERGWIHVPTAPKETIYEECDVGRVKHISMKGTIRKKLHEFGICQIKDVKNNLQTITTHFTP